MKEGKSFNIPKRLVYDAYKSVKANKGAGGIDGVSLEKYEENLGNNLYKLWNRLSSGSYFPKGVRGVEIPKKSGEKRMLGIPTIEDRVAQMVVRMELEKEVEPIFHMNSYGYRPGRSAIDAIEITRKRCWEMPWLLEFDIKGLFDNIDHKKLMKAVEKHTKEKWVRLYTKRFLEAPLIKPTGEIVERTAGTPQGGVISPVLANLFLHYAFDKWMEKQHPNNPWARYADDAVIHCRTKAEAENLLETLKERLKECELEIHPEKTKIVYCKSDSNREDHDNEQFDFLGYTFRQRHVKTRYGTFFTTFSPAVSNSAKQSLRDKVKRIREDKTVTTFAELVKRMNPVVMGWMNYYTKFFSSEAKKAVTYVNEAMILWVKRKYKRVKGSRKRAWKLITNIARTYPQLMHYWKMGIRSTMG